VPRRIVLAAVGVLTIVLAAACTDSTGGVATPGQNQSPTSDPDPSTGSPPSSGGETPTVEIPAPPKDLDLDGLKPCSLFTEAQLGQVAAKFKFDEPPKDGSSGDKYDAPMCTLAQSAEPFNNMDVLLVTSEGIGPWLSGKRNVDAWLVSVAGYPAVDYKLAGTDDEECVTSVGVAEGQQLMVDLQALQDTDYHQLCQITEQVAAMATQTLQTLR
jgi:hypothetical protein